MIKKVHTSTSISNVTPKEVTEYKIGHTTYKVVTEFNFSGENLKDILARLIKRKFKRQHKFDIIGISADYVKKINPNLLIYHIEFL